MADEKKYRDFAGIVSSKALENGNITFLPWKECAMEAQFALPQDQAYQFRFTLYALPKDAEPVAAETTRVYVEQALRQVMKLQDNYPLTVSNSGIRNNGDFTLQLALPENLIDYVLKHNPLPSKPELPHRENELLSLKTTLTQLFGGRVTFKMDEISSSSKYATGDDHYYRFRFRVGDRETCDAWAGFFKSIRIGDLPESTKPRYLQCEVYTPDIHLYIPATRVELAATMLEAARREGKAPPPPGNGPGGPGK